MSNLEKALVAAAQAIARQLDGGSQVDNETRAFVEKIANFEVFYQPVGAGKILHDFVAEARKICGMEVNP